MLEVSKASASVPRGNRGAKGKGKSRTVLENPEILRAWDSCDTCRGEARGQQSLQCVGQQGSDSRRVSCPRRAVRSGEGRLLGDRLQTHTQKEIA